MPPKGFLLKNRKIFYTLEMEEQMVAENKKQFIRIRGANENNLKNLSVDIPRDKFVVLTGLSGSGKSSLAFDTIYAEGQRRYMESLSSYARQFPWTDGEAGRREYRRTSACNFYRSEVYEPQSQIYSGNGYRDL